MNADLQEISFEQKSILRNLMELCQHDYSEFSGDDVNEHGLFDYRYLDHYWTESGRYPFFIRVSGTLAGFVLVTTLEADQGEVTYSLAEFFVLRKYRRQSIGQQAAYYLFNQFPGNWKVGQEAGNIPAQKFWRTIIARYTRGAFQEIQEVGWNGPIQLFRTP
jgi:predicted acetyltransferase